MAKKAKKRDELTIISLFSGALGLDVGLERAGFKIRVAVECNKAARETIAANRKKLPLIAKKLETVETLEILEGAGLEVGEATVVTGGPSCQPFSTAGRRGSVGDPRGIMFREFCRVVREARPRFFIMENVTGVLSAAVKHRPLKRRGSGFPTLLPEEQLGSALIEVLKELKKLKYHVVFDVLNAADFGVPQRRERVLFIGSRDGEPLAMPERTHSVDGKQSKTWLTLRDALRGLREKKPSFTRFSASRRKYLRQVPEGGNWRDLPKNLQKSAMGGAYISWGGRLGFYRRLSWDRTAPAITTAPTGKATMLCHPTALRPLSVREYARIQQFPDTWRFSAPASVCYRQIGNALPIGLGTALGKAIKKTMRARRRVTKKGLIVCVSDALLKRLAEGHRTRVNPPRMRKVKDLEKLREWNAKMDGKTRAKILDLVVRAGQVKAKRPTRKKPGRSDESRTKKKKQKQGQTKYFSVRQPQRLAASMERRS